MELKPELKDHRLEPEEPIGRGSFGVVYRAVYKDGQDRALKFFTGGRVDLGRIRRELERLRAVAQHPGIVDVLDFDLTGPTPYFAMKLHADRVADAVEGVRWRGRTLAQLCGRVDKSEALRLLNEIVAAMAYLHEHDTAHCDLKPSNVLLTDESPPRVKLCDFGQSRSSQSALLEASGTPFYAAPEQLENPIDDSGGRSLAWDVYSFGVVAYELATGRLPRLGELADHGVSGAGASVDPVPLTLPTLSVGGGGWLDVADLVRRARECGDVVVWPDDGVLPPEERAIVEKCLRLDPADRFLSMIAVRQAFRDLADARELARLRHEAELARQAREAESRRAALFKSAAVLVSALAVAALVAAGWAFAKQREAEKNLIESRRNEGLGWLLRAAVAEQRGKRFPDTLLYAAQAIGYHGFGRPTEVGAGDLPMVYLQPDRHADDFQKAAAWISSRPGYRPIWMSPIKTEAPATSLAVDPRGRWIAMGTRSGVRLFTWPSGSNHHLPETGDTTGLAVDPEGEVLAVAAGGIVRPWIAAEAKFGETLKSMPPQPTDETVQAAAADTGPALGISEISWSPGGEWLVGAATDGSILLWPNIKTSPERIPAEDGVDSAITSLSFSPDNAFVAGVAPRRGPRVWYPSHRASASLWTGMTKARAEQAGKNERADLLNRLGLMSTVTCVAVSPDGRWLATGTAEAPAPGREAAIPSSGGVILWGSETGETGTQASPEEWHDGRVNAMAWRPDGGELASGAADGTVKLWRLIGPRLELQVTLTGHSGGVTAIAYGPGGRTLASAGADGSLMLWDVSGDPAARLNLHALVASPSSFVRFTPEWQRTGADGWVEKPPASPQALWQLPDATETSAAFLADARLAAQEKRWHRVALREKQLARLGGELPKDVAEAAHAATHWTGHHPGDSFVNGEGIEFLWCPPGSFMQGSPEDETDRYFYENERPVTLTNGFWLAKYELSQRHWQAVMGINPSTHTEFGIDHPVENIDWHEARDFCDRLTDRERSRGILPAGWAYSLPSEAQWEYACRAGTQSAFFFGNDPALLHRFGNYNDRTGNHVGNDPKHDDGTKYTAEVMSYPPNPWGFHNMHGNVWEWCADLIHPQSPIYPMGPATDPVSRFGSFNVYRGGGFLDVAPECRSANRSADRATVRRDTLGFRPAMIKSILAVKLNGVASPTIRSKPEK